MRDCFFVTALCEVDPDTSELRSRQQIGSAERQLPKVGSSLLSYLRIHVNVVRREVE